MKEAADWHACPVISEAGARRGDGLDWVDFLSYANVKAACDKDITMEMFSSQSDSFCSSRIHVASSLAL